MMRHTPVAIVAALVCGIAQDAVAADVFASDIMEIVPVGAVAGDGKTPVTVRVLARKADGSALSGLKGRLLATEGTVDGFQAAGDGWYSFQFTPPTTTRPVKVKVTVQAGSLKSEAEIPVVPAGRGGATVQVNPPSLVLGRSETATLTFQLAEGIPSADLQIEASSGEVTDLTDMGGGQYTARYQPPAVNYPHLAIISAVAKDHPDLVASAVVRLQGAVDFPVTAPAGSSVVLKIAGKDYGPVKMDADGKGKVPIIVSPGVNEATKVVVQSGKREESPFDLQIPETRRVAFMPVVAGVPADGKAHAVRIVALKADGTPDGGAGLKVSADKGSVGAARHLGDGVYVVDYTPAGAGAATLTADIPGTKKNETQLALDVLGPLPATVAWDALGSVPASVGSASSIVVVPQSHVTATGAKTKLFVAVVDANGYPVPNQKVALTASSGSIPGSVTTNASGVATVTFTAPGDGRFVRIGATSGEMATEAALVASSAAPELVWPRSAGVQGEWEARLPSVAPSVPPTGDTTTPEPAPAPEPKSTGTAAAGAAISTIEVELPDSVPPGSTITVVATAKTDDGLGVTGQKLDFLTNAGTFGAVSESGDGIYTADLDVPKKATGELKISVVAESGVMGRATLAIDPGAVAAVKPVPKPRPDKAAKEPAEVPMVRVRLGGAGGSYKYAQRPSATPGPLLPAALVVGGPDGGRPAPLVGLEADARAWFLKYVGAHVGFRGTGYSITAPTFSDDAGDWLYHFRADVNGRYPFDVGSDQFWIGAAAGLQVDDFIVFKGCLEPGCNVDYEPLTLPGLELGAEIGAEVGPLFFVGNVSRGFAFGTVGYRTGVDADIGFEVHDNVFVDLGGAMVFRRLLVEGDTSRTEFGQLEDTQLLGRLSVGFQL
ncbi:MAG: Ig-like domain-containing protein [Alphaproteobacteria bacterium]|nr:Ig-like domain-containing protein [Alphaproteobacteria bacterium]